jgi:hypothetical protein
MDIVRNLGAQVFPFLDKIVPSFIFMIRHANTRKQALCDSLVANLAVMVTACKSKIASHVGQIIVMVHDLWGSAKSSGLQGLMQLLRVLASVLGADFRFYFPKILPRIRLSVVNDTTSGREVRNETHNKKKK